MSIFYIRYPKELAHVGVHGISAICGNPLHYSFKNHTEGQVYMSDANKINILGKHQIYLASKYAKTVQCVWFPGNASFRLPLFHK